MSDKSNIALLENLFSRPKGLRAIYDKLVAEAGEILTQVSNVYNRTSWHVVQGNPQITWDYQTEMGFLNAIDNLILQQHVAGPPPVGRPPFRKIYRPGDDNLWWQYANPFDGTTFRSLGSTFLKNHRGTESNTKQQPFWTPRSYFDFSNRSGLLMTADRYQHGYQKEDAQIVQLNVAFHLPQYSHGGSEPAFHGFGIVDRPITVSGWVGVWITPVLNNTNAWVRPWPITVQVGDGTNVTSFSVTDSKTPANDFQPGGITLTWNGHRIAVHLFRGKRGEGWALGQIPRWWIWPFEPWKWHDHYPWPYLEQALILELGNQAFFPSCTPLTIPTPQPVSPAMAWPGTLLSEITVEEVPYYVFPPFTGAINPSQLLIEDD